MNQQTELYRRDMSDQQAADFIHQQGKAAYQDLPFAPRPPQEAVEGLRRSTMTPAQCQEFVKEWGGEHFNRLPR